MGYWYQGVWHDSPTLQIAYDDPALIYGASVFTTCRLYEQSIDHPLTLWIAHQQRLCASIQALGWQEPNWPEVLAGVRRIAPEHPVIRITLFPDGRELIWGRSLPPDLDQRQQQGIVAAVVAGCDRSLPQYKTGNYLAPWLARQRGAPEAILVNAVGDWLETSTGNLWGWRDDCWYTPPLTAGILPGIARAYLVQWLRSQGKIVREDLWDHALVAQLHGLAYSNAVVQLIPIHTVLTGTENQSYAIDPLALTLIRQAFLA